LAPLRDEAGATCRWMYIRVFHQSVTFTSNCGQRHAQRVVVVNHRNVSCRNLANEVNTWPISRLLSVVRILRLRDCVQTHELASPAAAMQAVTDEGFCLQPLGQGSPIQCRRQFEMFRPILPRLVCRALRRTTVSKRSPRTRVVLTPSVSRPPH
jgi:hypothetical protein